MEERRKGGARVALSGALAVGISTLVAGVAAADLPDWAKGMSTVEKCGGVAKAKMNDCGTKEHKCGGMAKADNLPDEWVFTPVGLCDKIGGVVLEVKKR